MEGLLKDPAFRDRARSFLEANIRGFLPGLESAETIRLIPNEVDVAYSRPPHPQSPDYEEQLALFEKRVMRAKQLHTCEARRCLVPRKTRGLVCKRRAPFPVSQRDFIDENREWGMKRLHAYLNAWVPALSINARCNNDVKLLTNSRATTNLTFYITTYQTKKQGRHHNLSAVLAKGLAYHTEHTPYLEDLRNQQRLLLFRLVHTINREQELAAPMVMSYLMGWGDTYRSHHYTPVYWSSFVSALLGVFPLLNRSVEAHATYVQRAVLRSAELLTICSNPTDAFTSKSTARESVGEHEMLNHIKQEETLHVVTLAADSNGKVVPKCQVTDYMYRGDSFEEDNVIGFFLNSYEVHKSTRRSPDCNTSVGGQAVPAAARRGRGRPRHERVDYQKQHPRFNERQRVVRREDHHNLPNFIGRYFPSHDDPEQHDFYCASMLLLLKPWRNIASDLKGSTETWSTAFQDYASHAPAQVLQILSGIQYFHHCERSAQEHQTSQAAARTHGSMDDNMDVVEDGLPSQEVVGGCRRNIDEQDLAELLASQTPVAEELHGRLALEAARFAGIFQSE
ncbi:hypothetical protein PISMIDRAFT_96695, partial [Pisolithus microcarpus 441]